MDGEIEFNENVQPIELSPDDVPEGSVAQLTGWGYLDVRRVKICNFVDRFSYWSLISRFICSIEFRERIRSSAGDKFECGSNCQM